MRKQYLGKGVGRFSNAKYPNGDGFWRLACFDVDLKTISILGTQTQTQTHTHTYANVDERL